MYKAIAKIPRSKTEHVAQQLLDRIIEAELAPGSSFGTEAELLEQFDVSRPTLREGLRILESQGVLELRPGPGGGIMVKKPSVDILARGLSVFLQLHEVPFISVLKTREVLEPALAAEAALNGSAQDFGNMQASIDRMKAVGKDQAAFIHENTVFHSIIARASSNEVMEIFWATISALAAGEHHGLKYTPGNMEHIIAAHERILQACRNRDAPGAAEEMKAHLMELEHLVRKRYQNLVAGRARGPETRRQAGAGK
jgi:GntR family transcriptional regulator, transcriptional repressor for pyruvate dehydrogenase complex